MRVEAILIVLAVAMSCAPQPSDAKVEVCGKFDNGTLRACSLDSECQFLGLSYIGEICQNEVCVTERPRTLGYVNVVWDCSAVNTDLRFALGDEGQRPTVFTAPGDPVAHNLGVGDVFPPGGCRLHHTTFDLELDADSFTLEGAIEDEAVGRIELDADGGLLACDFDQCMVQNDFGRSFSDVRSERDSVPCQSPQE